MILYEFLHFYRQQPMLYNINLYGFSKKKKWKNRNQHKEDSNCNNIRQNKTEETVKLAINYVLTNKYDNAIKRHIGILLYNFSEITSITNFRKKNCLLWRKIRHNPCDILLHLFFLKEYTNMKFDIFPVEIIKTIVELIQLKEDKNHFTTHCKGYGLMDDLLSTLHEYGLKENDEILIELKDRKTDRFIFSNKIHPNNIGFRSFY